MDKKAYIIEQLKDGLIVSCQVKETDPLYMEGIIPHLAKAAMWGGAIGLRINEPKNIKDVREISNLPIIGLWKIEHPESEVFITPHMEAVDACVEAGCDIIAVDATDRLNHNQEKAYTIIEKIKAKYPDLLVLADVRHDIDAKLAVEAGADFVAPTLYRFANNAKSIDNPDFEMLSDIVKVVDEKAYVIMEGKINTPEQAIESLYHGAYSVVVGSAITRPHLVAYRFTMKMGSYHKKMPLKY